MTAAEINAQVLAPENAVASCVFLLGASALAALSRTHVYELGFFGALVSALSFACGYAAFIAAYCRLKNVRIFAKRLPLSCVLMIAWPMGIGAAVLSLNADEWF